jgi:hypothetical protein
MRRLSGFQNGLIAVYARILAAANIYGVSQVTASRIAAQHRVGSSWLDRTTEGIDRRTEGSRAIWTGR